MVRIYLVVNIVCLQKRGLKCSLRVIYRLNADRRVDADRNSVGWSKTDIVNGENFSKTDMFFKKIKRSKRLKWSWADLYPGTRIWTFWKRLDEMERRTERPTVMGEKLLWRPEKYPWDRPVFWAFERGPSLHAKNE